MLMHSSLSRNVISLLEEQLRLIYGNGACLKPMYKVYNHDETRKHLIVYLILTQIKMLLDILKMCLTCT